MCTLNKSAFISLPDLLSAGAKLSAGYSFPLYAPGSKPSLFPPRCRLLVNYSCLCLCFFFFFSFLLLLLPFFSFLLLRSQPSGGKLMGDKVIFVPLNVATEVKRVVKPRKDPSELSKALRVGNGLLLEEAESNGGREVCASAAEWVQK